MCLLIALYFPVVASTQCARLRLAVLAGASHIDRRAQHPASALEPLMFCAGCSALCCGPWGCGVPHSLDIAPHAAVQAFDYSVLLLALLAPSQHVMAPLVHRICACPRLCGDSGGTGGRVLAGGVWQLQYPLACLQAAWLLVAAASKAPRLAWAVAGCSLG